METDTDISNVEIPNIDISNIDISNADVFNNNIECDKVYSKRLDTLNHITLEYFSNVGFHNKVTNKNSNEHSISRADKKFYKKRIINETKKMLKDEYQNDVIRITFNKYIFSLINHFKLLDTNELLQKEFINQSDNEYQSKIMEYDISMNVINRENKCDEDDINIKDISNCNPDELLFKQNDCKILTMDHFINKKSKPKEKVKFPLKKNINLREPELKTKGIQKKSKKENIDNV